MTSGVELVETTLARYGAVTRAAIAELLADDEPAEHLYDLVRDYPARPGKGLRPALVLAACQAHGGPARDGLPAAVALEMMHNAFLIHDDVEDASPTRRGGPALHELHGVGLAVNAGDALAAMALRPLHDDGALGTRVSRRLLDEFLAMVRHTTEGQAMELGWRRANAVDLEPEDYLEVTARKTCWYTTVAPLRMGAIAGSRSTAPLRALSRFGFLLGIAFQIRDDLLTPLADIREGKRTLMLIHLLRTAAPAERAWLVAYLAAPEPERTAGDAEHVLELMERHGGLDFARAYGSGITAAAKGAFDDAFAGLPPSRHLAFIRALVPYVLARSR